MVDKNGKVCLAGGETDDSKKVVARENRWKCSWVSPAEMLVDSIDFRVKEAYRKAAGKKYYSNIIGLALGEFNCWFWGKVGYGDKRNGADDFALLRVLKVLNLATDKFDRALLEWAIREFNDFIDFHQQNH